MTKEDLKKLLQEELDKRSDVMLDAWLEFERNPSARTLPAESPKTATVIVSEVVIE